MDDPVPTKVAQQIDENLRQIYAPVLNDDLPDRLQALLDKLRVKDRQI